MKCILITNQKGGCGKTTITINLARALELKKFKVAVIDIDSQKSASTYFTKSTDFKIDSFMSYQDLKQFEKYDFVLIDSSPRLDQRLLDTFKLVDYVLIPVTASQLDFWATDDILAMIDTLKRDKRKKNNFNCGFVFNNCTNQKALQDIKNILEQEQYKVLAEINKRVAYSVEINKTVFETKNAKAIKEFSNFVKILLKEIRG